MGIRKLNTPKWMIFFIDVFISIGSVLIAYLLRFNFNIPSYEIEAFSVVIPYVFLIRGLTLYFSKLHEGILRFTGTSDAILIGITVFIGTLIFCLTNLFTYIFQDNIFLIPFSVIIRSTAALV